jgi:hypothetical protein
MRARHNAPQHMAAVLCNDSVRCLSAAQCVVIKDATQLIMPYIFVRSVMYSDDLREMMLLACPDEQHRDPVALANSADILQP